MEYERKRESNTYSRAIHLLEIGLESLKVLVEKINKAEDKEELKNLLIQLQSIIFQLKLMPDKFTQEENIKSR